MYVVEAIELNYLFRFGRLNVTFLYEKKILCMSFKIIKLK